MRARSSIAVFSILQIWARTTIAVRGSLYGTGAFDGVETTMLDIADQTTDWELGPLPHRAVPWAADIIAGLTVGERLTCTFITRNQNDTGTGLRTDLFDVINPR